MKGTKPMTPAERTRIHRERKLGEGWRLVQIHLEPRSVSIVAAIETRGMTTGQAINHLIELAGRKLMLD